jgi:hypothetical protein
VRWGCRPDRRLGMRRARGGARRISCNPTARSYISGEGEPSPGELPCAAHRPYANLGTLVYLADVLTKVGAAPDAKQALVQAGASGYQLAVDDSDQIEIRRRLTSPNGTQRPGCDPERTSWSAPSPASPRVVGWRTTRRV